RQHEPRLLVHRTEASDKSARAFALGLFAPPFAGNAPGGVQCAVISCAPSLVPPRRRGGTMWQRPYKGRGASVSRRGAADFVGVLGQHLRDVLTLAGERGNRHVR